ncbi:MAG: hypothetical protein ACI4M6_01560 [Christensenellaceae bacterium]
MKKIYESPEIEITLFKGEDEAMLIISGGAGDNTVGKSDFDDIVPGRQ